MNFLMALSAFVIGAVFGAFVIVLFAVTWNDKDE